MAHGAVPRIHLLNALNLSQRDGVRNPKLLVLDKDKL
jgi:hypothetical protein